MNSMNVCPKSKFGVSTEVTRVTGKLRTFMSCKIMIAQEVRSFKTFPTFGANMV